MSLYQENDGVAAVAASGGTGQYSYLWNDGTTTDTIFNLYAGLHSVTVSDENNCICISHITLSNPSKIGNFVWDDQNQNGLQDVGEPGLSSLEVQLSGTDSSGAAVYLTTLTDSSGNYAFDGLSGGFYQLSFDLPQSSVFTLKDNGDTAIDLDVVPATGQNTYFALDSECYAHTCESETVILD